MDIKFQSRVLEATGSSTYEALTLYGTQDELLAYQDEHPPRSYDPDHGRVLNSRLSQGSKNIWYLDMRWQKGLGEINWGATTPPSTEYGKKSARLSGSMLSLPLEAHVDYLTNWDHYLACSGTTAIPAWWATAKSAILSDAQALNYRWIKSLAELPIGADNQGRLWRGLCDPQLLGVSSWDIGVYTITEVVRCATETAAGTFAANRLNRIVQPITTFGITGGDWKCDRADAGWNGECWVVDLTYTRSGDERGWTRKLYREMTEA